MALWETKLSLEARVESGTRAKTVLGKALQEEMKWDFFRVIIYQKPTLFPVLLKVDRAWTFTLAHH